MLRPGSRLKNGPNFTKIYGYPWKQNGGEVTEWWNNSALVVWWEESVAPWFTSEQWSKLYDQIKLALQAKWTEVKTWWNTLGIVKWWKEDVEPLVYKKTMGGCNGRCKGSIFTCI